MQTTIPFSEKNVLSLLFFVISPLLYVSTKIFRNRARKFCDIRHKYTRKFPKLESWDQWETTTLRFPGLLSFTVGTDVNYFRFVAPQDNFLMKWLISVFFLVFAPYVRYRRKVIRWVRKFFFHFTHQILSMEEKWFDGYGSFSLIFGTRF